MVEGDIKSRRGQASRHEKVPQPRWKYLDRKEQKIWDKQPNGPADPECALHWVSSVAEMIADDAAVHKVKLSPSGSGRISGLGG